MYVKIASYYQGKPIIDKCYASFSELIQIKKQVHTDQLIKANFFKLSPSELFETVGKFLHQGADPNVIYFQSNQMLVAEWLSCFNGIPNLKLFEVFLKHGLDVTKIQGLLHTLSNCSRYRSDDDYHDTLKIIELMISHGADPNFQIKEYDTEEDQTSKTQMISPYQSYQFNRVWKHTHPEPEWFEQKLKTLLRVAD